MKCIVWEAGGGERGLEDGRALACLWTWQWGAARKPLKGRNRKSFSESRTWKNRNYKIWTWQSHKSLLFRCNESPASCLPFPLLPRGPPKTPIQRFRNRYLRFSLFQTASNLYVLNILEEYIKKCLLIVTTLEIGIGFSEKVSFCCWVARVGISQSATSQSVPRILLRHVSNISSNISSAFLWHSDSHFRPRKLLTFDVV